MVFAILQLRRSLTWNDKNEVKKSLIANSSEQDKMSEKSKFSK